MRGRCVDSRSSRPRRTDSRRSSTDSSRFRAGWASSISRRRGPPRWPGAEAAAGGARRESQRDHRGHGSIRARGRGRCQKHQQALLYLTMNAVQASASGQTVTVHVGTSRHAMALVKIIDRGEGMNAAMLERLKRPPFSTRPGGAGVGVAVARTFIEQHGGRVDYQSAPGRGTTVTVELPRRPPERAGHRSLCPRRFASRRGWIEGLKD